MEEGAQDYFRKLDGMGGMLKAIEQGFPQREILDASQTYQQEVEQQKRTIIGINEHVDDTCHKIPTLKIGPEVEQDQNQRLADLRKRRDDVKVKKCLHALQEVAQSSENMMPYLIAAVKAKATLGEICADLKNVFGTYQEPVVL